MDSLLSPIDERFSPGRARVPVLLPVALDQTYDYLVEADALPPPGTFVVVPFGPRQRVGIVWDEPVGDGAKPVAEAKLKPLLQVMDVPPLPLLSLRFARWIASYTLSPLGMVARMMMSAPAAFEPAKPRFGITAVTDAPLPPRMTPARERILNIAGDGLIRTKAALAHEAACTTGVIDGLVRAGCLVDVQLPERRFPRPQPSHATVTFSPAQAPAVNAMHAAVDGDTFAVTLLDGVTGSGKTEVYYEAVARALDAGRQAVILLPEIALTTQFLERFRDRFGCPPVEWHSGVAGPERGRIWKGVATGDVRVVVGARSALFLPYAELGLIVVDEEHDQSFKQEDRVSYQARDMAVVRASLGGCAVVLASATPSIESHVNARTGRYGHVVLPQRHAGAQLPDIEAIDLRVHPPERGRWLSPPLVDALQQTLEAKAQSLLFLNRRGYAPLTLCRKCGHRFDCPQCTAWLVEHRFRKRLNCHHCGFSLPPPERCPKCDATDSLVACGPGVERIAEEIAERFPDARLALLSSDLIQGMSALREVIARIQAGEADIIIGTQIVAKGHHFPGLATVGIVDGDLGLGGADPRAAERTFQLLQQVTGRAGRAHIAGRGFVQTHMPEHPVMTAIIAGDRDGFVEHEIRTRQAGGLPPYGRLVAVIVSAREKPQAEGYAQALARTAPPARALRVLGPAEAPIAVVRGRYRFRLLVIAPREIDVQGYMRAWQAQMPVAKGDLRVQIDVDPYSFL
ncbi:MAG: primosomal protein N' [Pseudomonadota bacterium]